MERFIKGGVSFESKPVNIENDTVYFINPIVKASNFSPELKLLSIDIECSLEMDLYSIAIYGNNLEAVLMVDPDHRDKERGYQSFGSEQELLFAFFRLVREYDPDTFIGWNLIGFDLQWLWRKCAALGIKFEIGTDGPAELLAPGTFFNQWTARIPGRAALDGINMAGSAYVQTEDYTKNVPPHIRAARKLEQFDGRIVSYVMTTAGPEPVQKKSNAPYDYDHYSQKQLAPIADMVLHFFDLDYRSLTKGGRQLSLFQ